MILPRVGVFMKWIGAVALLLCVAPLADGALLPAQAATAQNPVLKIATVSFNALVLQSNEGQRDLGALETKYAPRRARLQALNGEIEAARKQLSDTGDKLSDEERAARTQALSVKEKQLERDADDFRNDSQADSQQAFQRVAEKVYAFLQEYALLHGYTAIIERGTDAAPIVWYAADGIDITGELIKAYNMKSGVPALEPGAQVNPARPSATVPTKPAAPTAPHQ
jgi:outer membrane protein